MDSKTASGYNYTGSLTVAGDIQVNGDSKTSETRTNVLYINNKYFAFSEGSWTPEFGYVTDNTYADGWVPFTTWNPAAVVHKQTGFYTRTGNNVTVYYEIDIDSQGVSYISGGGINVENPGIRNLPFAYSPIPIADAEMESEVTQASWPNGIDGTTGAPALYTPVFPYPYTARLPEKNETLTLKKVVGVAVGIITVPGITRTFDGKTLYFYVEAETYDAIVTIPPAVPPWKQTGQVYGTLTNLHFAATTDLYHIYFNGEINYRTEDP